MVVNGRLSREEMTKEIENDMFDKTKAKLESLQLFYFKIVNEEAIRTSSFRYVYAKYALELISTKLNDTETLTNLAAYHSSKVRFEIAHPVKKDEEFAPEIKHNPATREQRFGKTVKDTSTMQAKF